ncbi:hypothetical protein HDU80_001639 [Chytriomyces hyalinus]|nr:hypothetical protein HDU80_001639 [Chytriomyces hyalinus]
MDWCQCCGNQTLCCSVRCRSINGGGCISKEEYLPAESSSNLDMQLGPLKRTTSLVKNLSHIMMDMGRLSSSSLSGGRTRHSGASCPQQQQHLSLVDQYGLPRSAAVSEKRQHEEISQSFLSETGADLHASLGLLALKRRKMVKL